MTEPYDVTNWLSSLRTLADRSAIITRVSLALDGMTFGSVWFQFRRAIAAAANQLDCALPRIGSARHRHQTEIASRQGEQSTESKFFVAAFGSLPRQAGGGELSVAKL
jgi:hypothetical protein